MADAAGGINPSGPAGNMNNSSGGSAGAAGNAPAVPPDDTSQTTVVVDSENLSAEQLDQVGQIPTEAEVAASTAASSGGGTQGRRQPPTHIDLPPLTHLGPPSSGRRSLGQRTPLSGDSLEVPSRARRTPTSPLSAVPVISPNSPPLSPLIAEDSPRGRARGYSLRRQLFFKNAAGDTSEGNLPGSARAVKPPSPREGSPSDQTKDGAAKDSELTVQPSNGSMEKGILQAGRRSWLRCGDRYRRTYLAQSISALQKYIKKMNELPPSKDGRKILLDVSRSEPYVDERTGGPYVGNTIRSSRYTLWNFLPKQLVAQFSKIANFYFLCVSILQMIPGFSTTGTYTTIVPLLFFITISISKEGYDDYRRYKLDKIENSRDVRVFRKRKIKENSTIDSDEKASFEDASWTTIKWRDVKVGDIVRLERDEWVPADLILLHSEGDANIAYIETAALDGETNLKNKQAPTEISKGCASPKSLCGFKAEFTVEDPNLDLYNFEGKVVFGETTLPLTNSQVIYRGSILRNTPAMNGLVIFTGEETKIRMNANKNPRTKAPQLQSVVNKIVVETVLLVLFLTTFCTVAYRIWKNNQEKKSWYLEESPVPIGHIFVSFIIMFNTLIPLSLYVSLEIVKLAQMLLLNDIDMYHEPTDTPFEARTSTINEDCGQVSYIFSDKTGTLTDNSMLFRKISVAGVAWLHDLDIQEKGRNGDRPLIRHKKRKKAKKDRPEKNDDEENGGYRSRKSHGDDAEPRKKSKQKQKLETRLSMSLAPGRPSTTEPGRWTSTAIPTKDQPQLSTVDMLRYLHDHPHTFFSRKARFMLLSMALCHTCLPEEGADGETKYQAASPDELALVTAAHELGYRVVDRTIDTISIQTFPNGLDSPAVVEVYEILDVIEFSSKRKRMSIIIRMPNKKIYVFCKGADTTMIELLRLRELAQQKAAEVERRAFKRKSLEAQEVIRRNSMNRPSIGGTPRPSFTVPRLQPIKDDFDSWLKSREEDVDMSSLDDESIYSRPSGQYGAARHSIAFGEPKSPLERDTTDEIVDESLVLDDGRVYERCFAHVNDFATEGLRTLLYAYRSIDENEYTEWKRIYHEATTSLVDRKRLTEEAADMIEQNFELCGATAIEDKLQEGVPDAIDKLRRANIKLWMLTGDKRETAINIGHSCRLIKDYSTITILDKDTGDLGAMMKNATTEIEAGRVAHSVVVVDGGTLSFIEADPELHSQFFDLTILTDSVVCCRASPSQKASLVKSIRTKVNGSITLAIGDGANDIAMIQEAHIGVGITGKEGLQAARVSDYSFAQFRYLLKFLLVHGHWNYVRTCKYTVSTFWKEMVFYLSQALYQRYNGYTGTSLYEPWSLSMFNTLFTSLPVIFIGIFEKDLSAATLLAVPELYTKGQRREGFNFKIYFGWMLLGVAQSCLVFFVPYALYGPRMMSDNGLYALGCLCYSVCVILISTKLQLIEMHNKSILAAISFVLSIGGWFAWNMILGAFDNASVIYNMKGGLVDRFGKDLAWWLVLIIAVMCPVLLDITLISTRTAIWPTDIDTFQEIERTVEFKKRLEEAASSELQQGWDRGKKKTSEELAREEAEAEVAKLLEQPRVMPARNKPATANAANKSTTAATGSAQPRVSFSDNGLSPTSPGVQRPSLSNRRSLVQGVTAPETTQEVEEEDIEQVVAKRFGSIKRR